MRLILHIGQHKTGSKALQTALHANPGLLDAAGCVYPLPSESSPPLRAWEQHQHTLFLALRERAELERRVGRFNETVGLAQLALRETVQSLIANVPRSAHSIILSSEDLFDMHTAHESVFEAALIPIAAEALAEVCRYFALKPLLVCYLRRQDQALAAHYTQFIKGTQDTCMPLWSFLPRFAGRLDYAWIMACWEQAFGIEAVMARSYEVTVLGGGIVRDFFSAVLRASPPDTPATCDLESVNISPSRDHVEYMRILNRRSRAGGAVLPRSLVLESALRDPNPGARGPAAWLSPKARTLLLARYAAGNAKLAARYSTLAALAAPLDCFDPEEPALAGSLAIRRLIALDAMAREVRPVVVSGSRLALFVLPVNGNSHAEGLARGLLSGLLGDPRTRPLALTEWALSAALRYRRGTAVVVLTAPMCGGFIATRLLSCLRSRGTTIVLCAGKAPESAAERQEWKRILPYASLLVCRDATVAKLLLEPLSARARPETHVAPEGHSSLFTLGQALIAGGPQATIPGVGPRLGPPRALS